ncbi:MAG: hypothetical protein Q8L74_13005 [Nitrospirota bacterium]|nr:hypothetical protein [Nitrospirota bacterium]
MPLRFRRYVSVVLLTSVFSLTIAIHARAEDPPQSAGVSIGEFVDQVLSPLAEQLSNESMTHFKFKLTHLYAKSERQGLQKPSGDLDALFYRMFDFAAPGSGLALEELSKDKDINDSRVREALFQEMLAWLDTRRLPLKRELLDLYAAATVKNESGYSLCVEGRARRYEFSDGRFHRLADGAKPCSPIEPKKPKSLKWEEES